MTPQEREAAILDRVREELVSEGYEVVLRPNALLGPPFLHGIRPDALAFRADKNLVVEVATRSPATDKKLRELQSRMEGQTGWELRLIWASPGEKSRPLRAPTVQTIKEVLDEIQQLDSGGHHKAALLLGWAALEALGRFLIPNALARPQTPARLIEFIATSGSLPPDEADEMRELIATRNRLIHGELQTTVTKKDVASLLRALGALLREVERISQK